MTDFVALKPVKHGSRAEANDLNLTEAAFLTFNLDPFAPDSCRTHEKWDTGASIICHHKG